MVFTSFMDFEFPLEVHNVRTFVSVSGSLLYTYDAAKCDNRIHDGWQLCVVPHPLQAVIYL